MTYRTLERAVQWSYCHRGDLARLCALFVCLLAMMLPTGVLTDNEEAMFLRALAFVGEVPDSEFSAVFPSTVARALSELAFGLSADNFSVPVASALWRVITVVLLAVGLAVLSRAIGLSALGTVLALLTYVNIGDPSLGGEWLFRSVESKVLAYALVLIALGMTVERRHAAADLALIAATYVHVLVGGFWTLFIWLLRFLMGITAKQLLARSCLYAALVLPLGVLLGIEQFGTDGLTGEAARAVRHTYAEVRNPHHVAPFRSLFTVWGWSAQIVLTGASALTLVYLKFSQGKSAKEPLTTSVLIGFMYLGLALILAWVDRHTHVLSSLFLFRPSSLLLLLATLLFWRWVERSTGRSSPVVVAFAVFILPVSGWSILAEKTEELWWERPKSIKLEYAAGEIRRIAPEGSVIIVDPSIDAGQFMALARLLRRPTYVNWKLMPHRPPDILEWSERMEFRERLFASGCHGDHVSAGFVDFILVNGDHSHSIVAECGTEVWRSGELRLLKSAGR